VGTFVTRTLTDESLAAHGPLRKELRVWLGKARAAGMDAESIEALFVTTFRTPIEETA
jgi:GntR family transcriptional regulator